MMAMKLLFDARWTRTDYYDGVSRYGASLIQALHDMGVEVIMLIHDEAQLKLLPSGVPHLKINHPFSPRELWLGRRLNRERPDAVFSPLQVMGRFGRRYPLVLTLQDIIYYKYPKPPTFLPAVVRLVWWLFHQVYWPQRLLLNGADAVTTVSQTSKGFIEELRLTTRPVTVVYNAPQHTELKATPDPSIRRLVYIGSFMPYKDVETLIRGMALLPKEYELHLMSKISPTRQGELEALVPADASVVFHNGVSEEEYAALLAAAWAVVTASRVEGFGLPIIEAYGAGVPAVVSDTEIFREVAGEHSLFFAPGDAAGFAAQVRRLETASFRTATIVAGKTHAARFSWHRSAEALLAAIASVRHTTR